MAVDLNDLPDRARVLEFRRCPPLHPKHYTVLALDAHYGRSLRQWECVGVAAQQWARGRGEGWEQAADMFIFESDGKKGGGG